MKADWLTAVTAPDASVISTTKFFEEANASFSAVASSAPAANVTSVSYTHLGIWITADIMLTAMEINNVLNII